MEILKNLVPQYDIRKMADGSWVASAVFTTREEAANFVTALSGISPSPEDCPAPNGSGMPSEFWDKSPEFKMGWGAFEHILSDAANPYPDDSPQFIEWLEGYWAAERWMEAS
jgi:hypothetical protein